MKTRKLTDEEIEALIAKVETNETLNRLFQRLFALHGLPKWMTEKKPLQDPDFLLEEWEKLVGEYYESDIMDAASRLFKYRKLMTFPTAAHIIAEIPPDTERKGEKHKPAIAPTPKPAELVPHWRQADVFAVAVGRWRSLAKDINAEGDKIRSQMSAGCFVWANAAVYRAEREYLANDPRFLDLYRDDYCAQFVACYKAGVFADIIEKIRANVRHEWEPEKSGKNERKTSGSIGQSAAAFVREMLAANG